MTFSGSSSLPPDHYRAYLLRIWQAGPTGPWRALIQSIETGEKSHFIYLESLFAFLLQQTALAQTSVRTAGATESTIVDCTQGESTVYARIFSAHFQSGKLDDVIRLVQEEILPAAQQQSGFHHLYFLTDPTTHKGVIVSLWASEADRSASESSGFLRTQLAKLGELVVEAPTVERFTVSAQR